MENKKRYSSDELNETDNLIKKYKVNVTTAIDNHSKTEYHEIDITEKELNKFLLIFNLLLEANESGAEMRMTAEKSQMLKTEYLIF